MDVKSHPATVEIEIKKGDHTYRFFMEMGAPLGEAIDASYEALSGVQEMLRQSIANAQPKNADAAPAEAVPAEIVS
jgi:hypothetical protein